MLNNPKTRHQQRVISFMEMAGHSLPTTPVLPNEKTRLLRAKLILEEALETVAALGFAIQLKNSWGQTVDNDDLSLTPSTEGPSLLQIVDGCGDISVVTTGTLATCGVSDEAVLVEIDMNNLSKFGPGHKIREDGKVIKPPDHSPPDILGVLKKQGYRCV